MVLNLTELCFGSGLAWSSGSHWIAGREGRYHVSHLISKLKLWPSEPCQCTLRGDRLDWRVWPSHVWLPFRQGGARQEINTQETHTAITDTWDSLGWCTLWNQTDKRNNKHLVTNTICSSKVGRFFTQGLGWYVIYLKLDSSFYTSLCPTQGPQGKQGMQGLPGIDGPPVSKHEHTKISLHMQYLCIYTQNWMYQSPSADTAISLSLAFLYRL